MSSGVQGGVVGSVEVELSDVLEEAMPEWTTVTRDVPRSGRAFRTRAHSAVSFLVQSPAAERRPSAPSSPGAQLSLAPQVVKDKLAKVGVLTAADLWKTLEEGTLNIVRSEGRAKIVGGAARKRVGCGS